MNRVQEMKHCCWYFFSTCFLTFTFKLRTSKQNRHCWVGLGKAAVCTKLSALGHWWARFGAEGWRQLGPHLPFIWRDTEGNEVFFWGVIGCLLWNGSLLWVVCSSAPLIATAGASFVSAHSQLGVGSHPEPGLSWAECRGMQPEGQWGEEKQAQVLLALLGRSTAGRSGMGADSSLARRSGVPVTRRACRRVICTWGCDNTNVDFFFYKSSEMFAKWVLFFCNSFIFT